MIYFIIYILGVLILFIPQAYSGTFNEPSSKGGYDDGDVSVIIFWPIVLIFFLFAGIAYGITWIVCWPIRKLTNFIYGLNPKARKDYIHR